MFVPTAPRRAACPHAATPGLRCPQARRFRQLVMGGYAIRPYGPAFGLLVGAGFMPARDRVPIPADVGIGPQTCVCMAVRRTAPGPAALQNSAKAQWESGACTGGHKGRPYRKTGGGAVGAHCICARNAASVHGNGTATRPAGIRARPESVGWRQPGRRCTGPGPAGRSRPEASSPRRSDRRPAEWRA